MRRPGAKLATKGSPTREHTGFATADHGDVQLVSLPARSRPIPGKLHVVVVARPAFRGPSAGEAPRMFRNVPAWEENR